MNQIPKEGEFCGVDCPCKLHRKCKLFLFNGKPSDLDFDNIKGNWKRLPICLKECPQIITHLLGGENESLGQADCGEGGQE